MIISSKFDHAELNGNHCFGLLWENKEKVCQDPPLPFQSRCEVGDKKEVNNINYDYPARTNP